MAREDLDFNVREVNALFSADNGLSMCFSAANGSTMRVDPVKLGGFSEGDGLVKKFRYHSTADGLSCSVDTEMIIPFGVEPKVRRNFEFAGNHGTVLTDIDMKGGMEVKSISVDNITIEGRVRRVGIIAVPECGGAVPEISWYENDGDNEFYQSADPFLVCLVELDDGFIWEVGTGDDLWRWNLGQKHHAGSSFSVSAVKNGIRIERMTYCRKDEDSIIPQRGLRFKWYFAWTGHLPEFSGRNETVFPLGALPEASGTLWFEVTPDTLSASAAVKVDENTDLACPCFESNVFRRRFNEWIRSAAGRYENASLVVCGIEPHVCLDAGHMERPKKVILRHWDIISLLDQWLWANRQLRKNGASLRFAGHEKTVELPSMCGVSQPAYLIDDEA